MRKLLLAVIVLFASVGLTLAAQVSLVKFDEKTKEAVVKTGKKGEDQVEKTVKITDKTKFKDAEDKDVSYEDAVKKMTGDKAVKRFDLTEEEGKATIIKFTAGKKKKDPS